MPRYFGDSAFNHVYAPTAPADPSIKHRPPDRRTLRCAAAELAARGLTYRDIAAALGLSEAAVRILARTSP